MKLHHRVTGTLTAAVFALTSLAPLQAVTTPPQIKAPKTPPTVKTPPAPPKVPAVPKVPVVKVPTTPKVPVVPKVQTPPKVPVVKVPTPPKVPTVKTPTTPKVPTVKVPVTKAPVVVKTPAVTPPKAPAVKTPDAPKVVRTPTIIKGTTGGASKTPGVSGKTPVVSTKTGVPSTTTTTATRGKITPATGITQPTKTKTPDAPEPTKTPAAPAAPVSKVADTAAPATQMTTQGGNNKDSTKDKDSSPRTSPVAADVVSAELLQDLGFNAADAVKVAAQTQDKDPATREAARDAIRVRADAKATQEALESFVGEAQAAAVGQKLVDPKTRADTQTNLKLVLDAAANLQATGVDDEKAHRVIDNLIRNGTTDKKVIDEITGRLIVKELTGKDVPQGDPADESAPTALDIARNIINAKGDLALVGVEEDDPQMVKALDDIVKGRVTDPAKAREIVETAAAESLEKAGVIPPGKPGESLQDRLNRAAKQQEEEVAAAKEPKPKPEDAKKPVKKPGKPISLADSLKGRLASVAGAEDSTGPRNDTGTSPSVLEIVFGSKKPRTGGPKGVKDGKQLAGITKGGNIKGGGAGVSRGKGSVGTIGDANGRIVAKPGQVSQPANTGGPVLAKDPDNSPVKDVGRSPVQNGTPVENTTTPNVVATPGAAGDPNATGNAAVAGEQDLPNTNPQQQGATDPAGSNMDTSGGTFTITDEPTTGPDGTTTVNFSVTGSPGGAEDGNYVTTYFSDGTYITERVTPDGGHELVGGGEGKPPANAHEGDSTNVVQGDQAVFAGDDSAENGGNGGGGGDGNGGGGNDDGDDDNDDDNGDNTADTGTPPATTEDNPATDAAAENDDTATASQEGTPNPDAPDPNARSGRLAEATQGRVGGDEQRRQNKAIDQRKNGNGASTPTGDETSSGVLLTPQEKSAFAKHLGLQRSRGVTTPTGEEAENANIDIASALEALAVRRGALINPAGGIGENGGSGQGFGKGGFTAGPTAPTGPAPKGAQAADDDEFGAGSQPGTGGATGAALGAPIGAPPAGVQVNGAASQAAKAAVRVNSSQVPQNVGR